MRERHFSGDNTIQKYLYTFNYDRTESALCELEARHIFGQDLINKCLLSEVNVEPTISAFIKTRVDILAHSTVFEHLVHELKSRQIALNSFKVSYLEGVGDTTSHFERKSMLTKLGFCFNGYPDFKNPTTTFALCRYQEVWYFGVLNNTKSDWFKHKHKPKSYSSSINMRIAKTLVNVAARANKEQKIIDACCGVGTVMLEACISGYTIDGCDINWKICNDARENLSFFNYDAKVYEADINDISQNYDAAIIDLPYSLSSHATESDIMHIIASTAKIAPRIVIVSTSEIIHLIEKVGLSLIDHCIISKRGKTTFARKIWVCELK